MVISSLVSFVISLMAIRSLAALNKSVKTKLVTAKRRQESKLNGIKVRVFFGKNVEKKHLCHHDKNYYYFWKSNIPVIN